jgi:S-adenosylmethionine synthetase
MADPPPGERQVEVVERKGIGHPDTICDALAEEVSRALSRHYVERFGRVLHHNVDKALLCGGSATARFVGGEVTAPIDIILAGRATTSAGGVSVPVEALAIESCRAWLGAHLHALDPLGHVRIECRFRPGSEDLVDLFGRGGGAIHANDTSIGVGFAPRSPLEEAVLDIERWINDRDTKRAHPEYGEDVKVMGIRHGDQGRLTVACAFVSAFVHDAGDYLAKKAQLGETLRQRAAVRLGGNVDVTLNAADDPARGSFYLTVTGTSAEAGDDGQVGRGNRVNGLITPGRPMTLEAAAGKNPVSHVGKLYNVAAGRIAEDLVFGLGDVVAAECMLVSRIGAPIDDPQLVSVRLRRRSDRPLAEYAARVDEITRSVLADLPALGARLIAGELGTY